MRCVPDALADTDTGNLSTVLANGFDGILLILKRPTETDTRNVPACHRLKGHGRGHRGHKKGVFWGFRGGYLQG